MYTNFETVYGEELYHHGIKGQKWGIRHGPPYPLENQNATPTKASAKQVKVGIQKFAESLKSIKYKDFDRLMTSDEVARTKSGSCHDQVVYEYDQLSKQGINPKIKFLIETDDVGHGGTTHSFVYFNKDGKTWWIENAWGGSEGLRSYANDKAMMADVLRRWADNNTDSKYPNVYEGNLKRDSLKPGMSLQDILDEVDFD